MSRKFQFPLTDEFEFTVELDESGEPYVERGTGSRVAWMVLGLFVVGIVGWFLVSYDGPEGWLLSVGTPAAIAAVTMVGVIAEPIFGSDRSAVVEDEGRFYLEMMTCSRWYVTAAGVAILATGASMFLTVRAPGLVGPTRPGRGSGLVSLAESVPFGEFALLILAVVLALYAFMRAYVGRMRIVET